MVQLLPVLRCIASDKISLCNNLNSGALTKPERNLGRVEFVIAFNACFCYKFSPGNLIDVKMRIDKINLYANLCLYAPVVGAIGGVCSGICARIWNEIPADFKLSAKVAEPLHPFVNSIMQHLFKGPGKYLIALYPITFLLGKAVVKSYQEKNQAPLKNQCLAYETIFTISLLTFTLFFVLTEASWLPALATIGPDFGDLSGHVLTVIGFTSVLSMGMQALVKEAKERQKILASLFSVLSGMASWTFLYNTTRSYHNLVESCSALGFAMVLFAIADWMGRLEVKRQ